MTDTNARRLTYPRIQPAELLPSDLVETLRAISFGAADDKHNRIGALIDQAILEAHAAGVDAWQSDQIQFLKGLLEQPKVAEDEAAPKKKLGRPFKQTDVDELRQLVHRL